MILGLIMKNWQEERENGIRGVSFQGIRESRIIENFQSYNLVKDCRNGIPCKKYYQK